MNGFVGGSSGEYLQKWTIANGTNNEEIPAFACVEITEISTDQSGRVVFVVSKPTAYGAQYSHIFNGPRPIPASTGPEPEERSYGEAAIGPVMAALCDYTPLVGETWGPRAGSWKLQEQTGGFKVVGYPQTLTGTDTLALVMPEPMLTMYGIADADINKGAVGDVSIYWTNLPAAVDTGAGVQVYAAYRTITAGKKVLLNWVRGLWEVAEVES